SHPFSTRRSSDLEEILQTKIIATDARSGKGLEELKNVLDENIPEYADTYLIPNEFSAQINAIKEKFSIENDYKAWQVLTQKEVKHLAEFQAEIEKFRQDNKIIFKRLQVKETIDRYAKIDEHLKSIVSKPVDKKVSITEKLDNILIHPILGYIIFFGLLLLIFQAVFAWSGPFMDFIDESFAWLTGTVAGNLPEGPINGLLTDGIIAGIGGIVIFVPQIVILFLFISIMEESGYMSRVVYLMDRWLKPFGLSGKSAVPLMSGAACAIP